MTQNEGYTHPEHGEMERYELEFRDRVKTGWRCKKCHVVGEDGREDEVFDSHDCENYESVREGISGAL